MFRELTFDDIDWIEECLKDSDCLSCDYSPFNIFAWKDVYSMEIDRISGCFVGRLNIDKKWYYLFPCGKGDRLTVIKSLEAYHEENFGYPFIVMCNRKQAELLDGKYENELRPGYADYIYNAKDLIELKGSKYHGKRNHIAQFDKKYNWRLEALNSINLSDAEKVMYNWHKHTDSDSYDTELKLLEWAVEYTEEFNIVGGIIYVEDDPVALAVGTFPGNDTFDVHIEKADTSYSGVYSKIMNEFAKYAYSIRKFSYINREEDMGLENLKKAKLSLHPAFLEEKFVCTKNV